MTAVYLLLKASQNHCGRLDGSSNTPEAGLNPSYMIIELTESCQVDKPQELASMFDRLRGRGFNLQRAGRKVQTHGNLFLCSGLSPPLRLN